MIQAVRDETINTWAGLGDGFLGQFRVHISRSKNMMTLLSVKQRIEETIRSYLTRFNVGVFAVNKPDPSILLMAAVSGVASKTDFTITLEKDPPMDLIVLL